MAREARASVNTTRASGLFFVQFLYFFLDSRGTGPDLFTMSSFLVNNFLRKPLDFLAFMWYLIYKMNEEETFQYGPFTVTVHPATNEEDEWVEVEES